MLNVDIIHIHTNCQITWSVLQISKNMIVTAKKHKRILANIWRRYKNKQAFVHLEKGIIGRRNSIHKDREGLMYVVNKQSSVLMKHKHEVTDEL